MFKSLYHGVMYRIKGYWGTINRVFYSEPEILSILDSLNRILIGKKSIARFGDGEFNLIRGTSLGFQKANKELALRLCEVLNSEIDNLEIGLPKVFGSLNEYQIKSARFWKAYMGMHRGKIIKMLNLSKIYCNTNMTRFWSGYRNKDIVPEIISAYKRIWDNRDVVFVEGQLTRMGVGNDLFSNAKSIRRILCPAKGAWDKYDEILDTVKKIDNDSDALYILALGPTATILAYDMCKLGIQALDLGHIDVQYEYYLRNAEEKIALEGKYVNENIAGREVNDNILDEQYLNSIIAQIG